MNCPIHLFPRASSFAPFCDSSSVSNSVLSCRDTLKLSDHFLLWTCFLKPRNGEELLIKGMSSWLMNKLCCDVSRSRDTFSKTNIWHPFIGFEWSFRLQMPRMPLSGYSSWSKTFWTDGFLNFLIFNTFLINFNQQVNELCSDWIAVLLNMNIVVACYWWY